jgi:hypothetical protein
VVVALRFRVEVPVAVVVEFVDPEGGLPVAIDLPHGAQVHVSVPHTFAVPHHLGTGGCATRFAPG